MIAALLARKTPDTTICDNLNISPSTLKTHIRNIHRRLGISSRHELAWLVTANPRHFRTREEAAALQFRLADEGAAAAGEGTAVEEALGAPFLRAMRSYKRDREAGILKRIEAPYCPYEELWLNKVFASGLAACGQLKAARTSAGRCK